MALVAEALDALPDWVHGALDNVEVLVDDHPPDDVERHPSGSTRASRSPSAGATTPACCPIASRCSRSRSRRKPAPMPPSCAG